MALILCPTCRLPVNSSASRCPLCTASLTSIPSVRHVPMAAAVALAATVAFFARRRA
jgi:predicted amidophosphoribosyltransferase